jgi:hypothetical protein
MLTRWGIAWAGLCAALALHVVDEAANDFLAFYNPIAAEIRTVVPIFPMFVFDDWLNALAVVIGLLVMLTPFANANAPEMRPLSYLFAAIMIGNGVIHIAASLWLSRLVPQFCLLRPLR